MPRRGDRRPQGDDPVGDLPAFEETTKGSIEVGKLADFVILSENPLTVEAAKLGDLKVVEPIKQGSSIFRAPDADYRCG